MPYIEKLIYSGDYLEIERCFVSKTGRRMPRGENVNETTFEQMIVNSLQSQKRLMRLLCCNFSSAHGDLFVTLTHADPPESKKEAKRARKNFFERVRYHFKKHQLGELKYIATTELQSQWHHHIIIPAMPDALETIKRLWGLGRVTVSVLDDRNHYLDLIKYLVDQQKKEDADAPRQVNERRWDCSKNLLKPIVKTRPIKQPRPTSKPRVPKGYRLLPDWQLGCDRYGNFYQSYRCVKIPLAREPQKRARR